MRRPSALQSFFFTSLVLAAGCSSSSSNDVGDASTDAGTDGGQIIIGNDANGGTDGSVKVDSGVDAKVTLYGCSDGLKDGTETDIDCGGIVCGGCDTAKHCSVASDCQSGNCTGGACVAATCSDHIQNGDETAADCGGGTCPACANGNTCGAGTDCSSGFCLGSVICAAPTCADGFQDGTETGIDCGGGNGCPLCGVSSECKVNGDCGSGTCSNGACTGCLAPSDCPAPVGTAGCVVDTCTLGLCGQTNAASGTVAGSSIQTSGDCQQLVCDGNGNATSQDDATDLPTATSGCETAPACTGSPLAPSFTDAPVATACTDAAGDTVCDGNGNCVACNTNGDCPDGVCSGGQCVDQCVMASDCPPPPTTCMTSTCVADACGFANVAAGTACTTGGLLGTCGAAGICNPTIVPPVCPGSTACAIGADCNALQASACITNVCTGGCCATEPAPTGTACIDHGGHTCDGQGACVACETASDCPATGNECVAATCTANVCGTTNLGASHVLSSGQTPGDCQKLVCNGVGGVTSADDATDLPSSTTACETNPSCAGAPLAPSFTPAETGTDCTSDEDPPNHVCGATGGLVAGSCVECNVAADCTGGAACVANACLL